MPYKNNTNSFTIAHYILMFLLVLVCLGVIVWVLSAAEHGQAAINAERHAPTVAVSAPAAVEELQNGPCVQQVTTSVARIWAYDPANIPAKYTRMVYDYVTEVITTPTRGYCNDNQFVCLPGQVRSQCDPCAMGTGRMMARDAHMQDAITENCE